MPQTESCSSDCRMRGVYACGRSWLTEIGSAATQPNTRHMVGAKSRAPRASECTNPDERSVNDGAKADLVGAPAQAVRAGAPGRRGAKPSAGAARGGHRVPEGFRCAHRDLG